MFSKIVSVQIKGSKPIYKDEKCIEYNLSKNQILSLTLHNPPYQTDLNMEKVGEMNESYRQHPEFGRFKNIIVVAVRMTGDHLFYLVDGQHRVELMRMHDIVYPFRVLFYPIQTDDEMRQLFREMNYDSHKNLNYVSLGTDTARIADELIKHYANKPFTTKRVESRLFTLKGFVDALSEYIKNFTTFDSLLTSLELNQRSFIESGVDFTHSYVEERECIRESFIMPLKECNFIQYLLDSDVEPDYKGKGKTISKTITLTLKKSVWNHHVGMGIGEIACLACNITRIHQMSFHCGHVIAKSKGGLNTVNNLKPICQSCNSSMGTQNMDDFIKSLA